MLNEGSTPAHRRQGADEPVAGHLPGRRHVPPPHQPQRRGRQAAGVLRRDRRSSCERPTAARGRGPARLLRHQPGPARGRPGGLAHAWTRARRSASSGESGSGKTVLSRAIMGLLPRGLDHPDRVGALRRHRDPQRAERRAAQALEHPHRHGVPGPHDLAQPGAADRQPDHRAAQDPPQARPKSEAKETALSLLMQVGHPLSGRALRGLPGPALGRHAPARHDRHRPGLRAAAPHGGRAHHRPRRHGAGADPRPAGPAAARPRHGA